MRLFLALFFLFSTATATVHEGGDPLFSKQWYLENKAQSIREEITDIKSNLKVGTSGKDIGWRQVAGKLQKQFKRSPVVAVLDSGIDYEHEDLKHSIYLNEIECDNSDIPLGKAEEDRDGNSYKGDCKGINLTARDPLLINRPLDDEVAHGTHVAGVIAAKWNNSKGIVGVHEDIKILPIKVTGANEGRIRKPISQRIAEGIRYAVSRKVDVINLSMGYPIAKDIVEIREAINEATENGIFIVAAAGNNAHSIPVYPCAYKEVICVGSLDNQGKVSSFSNHGAHVDVYAPGEFIYSTFPTVETPKFSAIKGYEIKSGTSQATPLVSAALALLKATETGKSYSELSSQFFQNLGKSKSLSLSRLFGAPNDLRNWRVRFKETSVITVDSQLEAVIPVELISLDNAKPAAPYQVSLISEGYSLKSSQLKGSQLKIRIKAKNAMVEYRPKLKLQMGNESEVIEVSLSQTLNHLDGLQRLKFENSKDIKRIGSIALLNGKTNGKYFLKLDKNSEGLGLEAKVWQRSQSELKLVGQQLLEGATALLGVYQADANGNGTNDLIFLALGAEKENEEAKPNQILNIYYFDKNMRPLYNSNGRVVKRGKPLFNFANFGEFKKTRWVRASLGKGLSALVPAVVEAGYTPEKDKSLQQKRGQGLGMKKHLYVLQPFVNESGEFEFETRIVDNAEWRQNLKKSFRLRYYEKVEVLMALSSSDEFLVRIGQLESSSLHRLRHNDGRWDLIPTNWSRPLLGYGPAPIYGGHGSKAMPGLYGLLSQSRLSLVGLDASLKIQEEVIFDLPEESEHIIRPLMLARDQGQFKAIVETGQKLFGFIRDRAGQITTYEKSLLRTMFFGQVITQVNAILQDQNNVPVLYVDDTQINSNSIRIESLSSQTGFQALLRDSYSLPENCQPLNPARWNEQEAYRIQILCRVHEGLELRSLPIQDFTH